jgi:hypothetical protein
VPAQGPVDLIRQGENGAVDDDLHAACMRALRCSREAARASTRSFTYDACRDLFRAHLVPLTHRLPATATQELVEVSAQEAVQEAAAI